MTQEARPEDFWRAVEERQERPFWFDKNGALTQYDFALLAEDKAGAAKKVARFADTSRWMKSVTTRARAGVWGELVDMVALRLKMLSVIAPDMVPVIREATDGALDALDHDTASPKPKPPKPPVVDAEEAGGDFAGEVMGDVVSRLLALEKRVAALEKGPRLLSRKDAMRTAAPVAGDGQHRLALGRRS